MTDTRQRPDQTADEELPGYTGLDNGDTDESSGYPQGDPGGNPTAEDTGVPIGETGQDSGYADLPADPEGPKATDDHQHSTAPTKRQAREEATRQESKEAAAGDDTDEDGERVDTSDIGYVTPTGEKEPSA